MVRRGSTVRVRQRASGFLRLSRRSVVSAGVIDRLRRPRSVHQCPPWPLSRAQFVEQTDRMLASVACEVAVMTVDHGQAGARPCSGRGRRWRCRHGVRRSRRCVGDRRSCVEVRSRRHVVPASTRGYGTVQVEVAAPLSREEKRAVRTRGLLFDRVERDRLQRHCSPARLRLRAFQATLGEGTANVDDARPAIDVAPFERKLFGWAKPSRGREDHHWPVAGREIRGDRVEFGP